MMRPKTTYHLRWTWCYHHDERTLYARLRLGLSVQEHYDCSDPLYRPLDFVRVEFYLLLGTLALTIQLRPLTITDWRPSGGSNA